MILSGWKGEALIDEKGKQGMIARNFAYKPIATSGQLSQFRYVTIKKVFSTYLQAN
ncbi:MAG: hypothetical protein ISS48_04900 [Candidatus Aenigmarchaeota archaeon]|nr:hypothetical protein [Candidatus Aenigmarchaeota archaeon]